MNYARRLRGLRQQLTSRHIAGILVTHLPDVRYLCGFSGSNAALAVTPGAAVVFTDGRYISQVKAEVSSRHGYKSQIAKNVQAESIAWLAGKVRSAAFDPLHTSVHQFENLKEAVPGKLRRTFLQPTGAGLVEELRLIKDADELELITDAALLGARLFDGILPRIRPGASEISLAAELEYSARLHGAEGMSFETIVASGPRSALPHGRATRAQVPRNGFITMDFGVVLGGYCSDMTRTVYVGSPGPRERAVYDAVLEAQQAAIAAIQPGVSCGEVDEAARSHLKEAGLDKYFTHSTGHGVGIEIHEAPRIAQNQEQKLLPGMVVTIEPGVYIEGEFGIRIEDMVLVTRKGAQVLTPSPKALIEL